MPDVLEFPDAEHGDGWRTEPLYTISEAAHLAHVSPITVRRWLFGYAPYRRQPSRKSPPVFGGSEALSPFVSFLQLVEIVIAADFRKVSHVKLDVVRQAHANARGEWGLEFPFAHLRLESLGGHIVHWLQRDATAPRAQAIDRPEQFGLPGLVQERIRELDYVRDLAARWYPVGKAIPIVVDPLFSSGLPTIVGRGVTVNTIYKRWKADQSINFIAGDLQLDTDLVERALQYADKIAA